MQCVASGSTVYKAWADKLTLLEYFKSNTALTLPDTILDSPSGKKSASNAAGGDPNSSGGDPKRFWVAPSGKKNAPNLAGGDPDASGGDPRRFCIAPNGKKNLPGLIYSLPNRFVALSIQAGNIPVAIGDAIINPSRPV
ncbi:hypothetical protein [Methylomonas albis]|nr:hypothetical protein [Methylomonas albis]